MAPSGFPHPALFPATSRRLFQGGPDTGARAERLEMLRGPLVSGGAVFPGLVRTISLLQKDPSPRTVYFGFALPGVATASG
jgi:hypothetical protein